MSICQPHTALKDAYAQQANRGCSLKSQTHPLSIFQRLAFEYESIICIFWNVNAKHGSRFNPPFLFLLSVFKYNGINLRKINISCLLPTKMQLISNVTNCHSFERKTNEALKKSWFNTT